MVSVRSNTKFFKAEKNPGYENNFLSMPIHGVKGADLSNMPLNQIPFRLTQHPNIPFAITASDNAIYEEYKTKERVKVKEERVQRFLAETKARVDSKERLAKIDSRKILTKIEKHIKEILAKAIEFSLKSNMIKKSGKVIDHDDVAHFKPGPPTFNEVGRESKEPIMSKKEAEHFSADLSELQAAIDKGTESKEIMKIVDKILEERDSVLALQLHNQLIDNGIHGRLHSEETKRNETPEFNILMNLDSNLLGVPPRDFKAFIPLLKILGIEDYDKNDYDRFDMVKSLKVLKQLWKTLDNKKIK